MRQKTISQWDCKIFDSTIYLEQIDGATISFMIFWDFSMFYQIFLSPQVKRWVIITYNMPNDLRLRKLGN